MGSHIIIEVYGALHTIEMELIASRTIFPEVESALQETTKHIQAAQASLKTALTFRPKEEE